MSRPIVLVESPYKGNIDFHMSYLRLCFRDSIQRGEVPIATHKLYTDVLNDTDPYERRLGMSMLKELIQHTDFSAVYYDLGVSSGMVFGINYALEVGKPIKPRSLFLHPVPHSLLDLINKP